MKKNKFNSKTEKPKNLKKVFLFLCFFVFQLFFSYQYFSIYNFAFASNTATDDSQQQINDFSLAGYGDKGKKTWDVFGKSADMFSKNVILKKVISNLYGEKENVKLTADKGDFNKIENKMYLEKDVVITTSSGAKLTTDSLDWDRKNNIVTTKDRVTIERDNVVSTSLGAIGQPGLNKFSLEKDVKLEINPEETKNNELPGNNGGKIIITCDGPLVMDYEKNRATFNNNVKVDRQESQIYSDKIDVYFEKDPAKEKGQEGLIVMNSKIEMIVALGNVKIIRGENISYSDAAFYSALENKIVLSGRPKLVIYSAEKIDAPFGN